eukprot:1175217-Pyramimonas_sp.AAC.1
MANLTLMSARAVLRRMLTSSIFDGFANLLKMDANKYLAMLRGKAVSPTRLLPLGSGLEARSPRMRCLPHRR